MPGKRAASIDLPTPGAPVTSMWCPPAAATSSAWRACACPRTSARSGQAAGASVSLRPGGEGASGTGPHGILMASASWARWNTSLTLTPASSASFPHPRGTAIAASSSAAAKAAGSIPRTARTDPSRPSSPMTYRCPISRPPIAARIATAMPRSNAVPLFGVSAGERLIVRRA